MKILSISLTVALFSLFLSCDNDSAVREKAAQTLPQPSPQTNTNQMPASGGALAGVQHYICPNNCQGSGGAAQGNCPVCGTGYLHNQAFHANDAQNQATPPPTPTPNPATPATEPAQNTAGVWHYTCPKGCAGGAGIATACSKCGGTLAHNAAYHN
jgi:hypothetical protein